jgi:hypothetical protein
VYSSIALGADGGRRVAALSGSYAVPRRSPTNEAAVLGLTAAIVDPMAKGAGVLVVAGGDRTPVEPLG